MPNEPFSPDDVLYRFTQTTEEHGVFDEYVIVRSSRYANVLLLFAREGVHWAQNECFASTIIARLLKERDEMEKKIDVLTVRLDTERKLSPLRPGLKILRDEKEKKIQALTADSRHLGNLLAVLHGDGGQYQGQHGTKKAVEDALTLHYERLEKLERVEAQRDEHTQTIARFEAHCAFTHDKCAQYLKTIQALTAERDTLTAERDEHKKRITELEHDFLGAHARHGQKKARAEKAEAERDVYREALEQGEKIRGES